MSTEIDLVGKRVLAISISEEYLHFETDAGPVTFRVEGDCCSWSYFYDFTGVANVLGRRVRSLSPEPAVYDEGLDDEYAKHSESAASYVFEITTKRGTARFSHRNDSNGYYGGMMMRVNAIPPGTTLVPVTRDGHAVRDAGWGRDTVRWRWV